MQTLKTILNTCLLNKQFIDTVLSNPAKNTKSKGLLKATFRPITAKEGELFQHTEYFTDKAIHRNFKAEELTKAVEAQLTNDFKQGILFTAEADYHLFVTKAKEIRIIKKPPTKRKTEPLHNRSKRHILQEGSPIPFLIRLGVMDPKGKVIAKKSAKFKQINRFLEIIRDLLPNLENKAVLRIVDFGCGKAYLTFALYHYLNKVLGISLEILGLDLKADVVEFCNRAAKDLNFEGLHFQAGSIDSLESENKADMVIALHACDTATDAAIEKAVRWEAGIILAVPCCQHELYKQVQNSTLAPLLEHGILKERLAALATDAARAKILELLGYQCKVIEFIDIEQTSKNLLIKAVKRPVKGMEQLGQQAEAYFCFKNALQITPSLERRFRKELEVIYKQCRPGHG